MNQTEIGKFTAKCHKEKKLMQTQLTEKLNNISICFFYLQLH